ncbi:hypothetical protein BC628DRAFT_13181 [Trametes gibbosa]|nr:hypothetical protein BC628DRAFT_13181 [Trametes gibbosa]
MARGSYQGYVDDSEDEEIMTFDTSALLAANAVAGPSFIPPSAPRMEDTSGASPKALMNGHRSEGRTASSIQTPNFTDQPTRVPRPPPPLFEDSLSTIQTPNFTADRSYESHISSFTTNTRPQASSIQTAITAPKPADSSISTSTSASSAPRPKPRPRPAYKGKSAAPSDSTPAVANLPSAAVPFTVPSLPTNIVTPHVPSVEPIGAPLHPPSTSSTTSSKGISGKGRASDSGVEIADMDLLYSQDIAERAKMRSRARTQTNKAPSSTTKYVEDVIELSSEDELQSLPPVKSKPKPKPKGKKVTAGSSPHKEKVMVVIPPPLKRTKTSHVPDPGFESDVNTIPVPTSDFPLPVHIPGEHSSQLPPSDPPPSIASSVSARTHPQPSQEVEVPGLGRDLSPLSSPPPPMPRKRKRPDLSTHLPGNNDLTASNADASRQKTPDKEPPAPLPPPSPIIVPETQPPAKSKPVPRKKRKDPLEDEDEEWGGDVPAKPTKSRKKARTADDDDFGDAGGGGGGGGGGADEDDEEWGAPRARGKGKKAPKKDAKRAAPRKSRAKGKEKEQPPKSKAIIENSGDEHDKEAMPPPPMPSPATTETAPTTSQGAPSAGKDSSSCAADSSKTGSGSTSSGKKSGPKAKAKGKQRGIVLSDEDDEEVNAADISTNSLSVDIDTPAPNKTGRKPSGGQQSPDTETKVRASYHLVQTADRALTRGHRRKTRPLPGPPPRRRLPSSRSRSPPPPPPPPRAATFRTGTAPTPSAPRRRSTPPCPSSSAAPPRSRARRSPRARARSALR